MPATHCVRDTIGSSTPQHRAGHPARLATRRSLSGSAASRNFCRRRLGGAAEGLMVSQRGHRRGQLGHACARSLRIWHPKMCAWDTAVLNSRPFDEQGGIGGVIPTRP
jgi:hypothetical protein